MRNDLAVVGMDISFPGCDGLARFGHLLYRGFPMKGESDNKPAFGPPPGGTLLGAVGDACVTGDQIALITLSQIQDDDLPDCLVKCQKFDTSSAPNPMIAALVLAEDLLVDGKGDAVLIYESQLESQRESAIILTLHSLAIKDRKRTYAVMFGISETAAPVDGSYVGNEYQNLLKVSAIHPEAVGLMVTSCDTNSFTQSLEAKVFLSAYQHVGKHSCALSGGLSGLPGLIKTAWCTYWRVIPGTSDWNEPSNFERWEDSGFYVPSESRTWFMSSQQQIRIANFNTAAGDGSITHLFLKEENNNTQRPDAAIKEEHFLLFPLADETIIQLSTKISDLQKRIESHAELSAEARHSFDQFLRDKSTAKVQICLLGHNVEELKREIGFAYKGVTTAYDNQSDWQTPMGSYFTATPLGDSGNVAFVYPGAFNSYPGVGQDLFYLFPNLYESLQGLSGKIDELINEKILYPRSMSVFKQAEKGEIEARLNTDPMAMLISGTSIAALYTFLLRDVFELKAESAFGYSLGEISMLFANQVWNVADETSAALRTSPLFRTRLAGPQNAVRSHFKLQPMDLQDPHNSIWENHLLMAGPEMINAALADEPHVYLTHINTPQQVVIGGDPAGCRRVIQSLKVHSIKAPFNYALHNIAISSEFDSISKLLTWPIFQQPDMNLYSASSFQQMIIDPKKIANQIAAGLCTCLNFPKLVQQVYQDGSRIFIELGAGSSCARWINDSLKGKPHAAFSINHKGADDYSSILRLLARLICHRVPVNLCSIYC